MGRTYQTFHGANFTGHVGQCLAFVLLGQDGREIGSVLKGKVTAIHRQGRDVVVNITIPEKHCYHTYYAKDIYYKGRAEFTDNERTLG